MQLKKYGNLDYYCNSFINLIIFYLYGINFIDLDYLLFGKGKQGKI